MGQFDEKHVKICGGTVVWDGVTQPEITQQGTNAGKPKWTLKAVFEPHNPDIPIYNNLALRALQESKWRGNLPAGGRMPIGVVQAGEFGGMFTGWPVISFKTSLRAPDMYDENGAVIDQFRLAQLLYTGQRVDVLAHCYEYDAAGNKGISAGMDAFAIIASAQMPRLVIAGGVDTKAAFGGAGGQQQQPAAYNPGGGAAATYQPQQQQQPASYQAPAQAHNFLPGGQQQQPAAYNPGTGGPATYQPQQQPAELAYVTPDGGRWTLAQLKAAQYPDHVIAALPRA